MLTTGTGVIDVSDGRLYYEVAGQGDPLVLIHAFSMDHRMWDFQMDAFAGRWRVIRYDMRGFGKSTTVQDEQPYSHARDLSDLLKHLGVERAHVCGLSIGGEVAIDFALLYPSRVRSLILVDSVLDGFQWSDQQKALDGAVWKTGREVGIDAARRAWQAHPLFVPLMERPDAARLFEVIVTDYSGWHWQHRNPATWAEPVAIGRLSKIAVPALVVAGERDLPDFLAVTDVLADGIPGARKVILPGVGHMSPMESPDEFNRVLVSFLTGL